MLLITQFLLINTHFTLNLFAGLVCFAVTWLYFDAWLGRRDMREGTKALGFLLLALSYVIHATIIEQQLLTTPLLGTDATGLATAFLRISGYLVLIIGQVIDPIQPLPSYRKTGYALIIPLGAATIPLPDLLAFTYPLLGIITAFLYLRRATVGLEHHLKPISWSLILFSLSDFLSLASVFRETGDITIANFTAPFQPLWLIEHAVLVLGTIILGRWIWSYLVKRLETQLLMIFTTLTLILFLVTTIFFTSTSLKNLETGTLLNLETNVRVLNYALETKTQEALSDSELVSQNRDLAQALADDDKGTLQTLAENILLTKKQSFLVITGDSGEVIVRADDPEKSFGSLSSDPVVKKALDGDKATSIITKEGIQAPEVSVRAATPIFYNGQVIGTALVGTTIDNAFVDGLKEATGLEASVYAGNIRSATTLLADDGKTRWIGVKEENDIIKATVLEAGETYTGTSQLLNVPYHAAYLPLKNISGQVVGMLFVGEPQVTLLATASSSIELTFLVTAGLLILSVYPSLLISNYIIKQIL